jgi:MFS family permease
VTRGGPGRGADAQRALDIVRRSTSLARAELAFGATCMAEWAFTIGLGIVAFQDGGASRVGLVGALRLFPSAALAPVASTIADRWPRERVLGASSMMLAGAASVSAMVLAVDGPLALVYVLAAVATIALTPYRAAHSALQPSLCKTTDELAAANIVRTMVEAVSVIAGPLGAAGLIHLTDLWCVFAATAGAAAVAAGLVANLRYERPPQLAGCRARAPDERGGGWPARRQSQP